VLHLGTRLGMRQDGRANDPSTNRENFDDVEKRSVIRGTPKSAAEFTSNMKFFDYLGVEKFPLLR
jgi:hypothetical protein